MTTADIVASCRALDGVSVRQSDTCAELLLHTADGTGSMRFYPLFPGLTLAHIRVDAPVWPAPQPQPPAPDARGPLLVNYCIRGRCELVLNDSRRVFLTAGQLALTERFAQKEYVYPGRLYEGIELFIDPPAADGGVPLLQEAFGLDLTQLRALYCPAGATFLADSTLPAPLLARLLDGGAPTGMKTGLIDLLSLLLDARTRPEPAQPVYCTKSQVEIARRTERLLTEDLSRQHTVRELAARFSVSESSLKHYFFAVYGQSISQYTLHRRMQLAAQLLTATRLPVSDVAARAGYLNQSKFSAAFRRAYACPPLEYRRVHAISGE